MRASDSESRSAVVLELAEEFLDRYRKGQRPSIREYVDRRPDLADEIREVFPAMAMMENIAVADDSLELEPVAHAPAAPPSHRGQLGDYRILREVGRGGMGVVYEAEQVSLGRHVALKVLPAQVLRDERTRRRFEREARAAARLHHTNIVPVFGVGEQDDTPYYVMQFIQGQGLDAVIDELRRLRDGLGRAQGDAPPGTGPVPEPGTAPAHGPALESTRTGPAPQGPAAGVARSLLTGRFDPATPFEEPDRTEPAAPGTTPAAPPSGSGSSSGSSVSALSLPGSVDRRRSGRQTYWQGVARIGMQVADALAYAHAQGVIHRDVKPSNLLLDARGTVWVTDFGLAKADDGPNLTHTGDVLGTLRYMPPEAFEGRADRRGDVYSLGLTLYEMLAFRPAYADRDRARLVRRVTTEPPPPLRKLNPEVPRDLETVVHKAIEREPADRYASAADLADDLRRFADDEPIRARPVMFWERGYKWARRRPAMAALLTLVQVLLASSVGVFAWSYYRVSDLLEAEQVQRTRAEGLARSERLALEEANAQTKVATERAEQLRRKDYIYRVDLALRESRGNNVARAVELLDGCPADLRGWEWEYVRRQCHLDLQMFQDAAESVNAVAYSPDGRLLATGSGHFFAPTPGVPGDVVVRDADTGAEVFARRGLAEGVRALAFTPDGKALAVGHGRDLVVWELATGKERFRRTEPEPQGVCALAFSPDGRTILVGYGLVNRHAPDAYARLLRADTGVTRGEPISGLPLGAWGVAFSPDGRQVALTADGHVHVRDVSTRELVHDLHEAPGFLYAVAFSPDGRFVAAAGLDRTARLYDRRTGALVRTLSGHEGFIRALAFSPDARRLITGAEDKTVKLWSVDSDRELATFHGHTHFVQAVAFNPDGLRIASGGKSSEVKVWFTGNGLRLSVPHQGWPRALAISPDGRRVASSGSQSPRDARTSIWDLATSEPELYFPTGDTRHAAFGLGGRLLATGTNETPALLWDAAARSPARALENQRGVYSLAVSPDGRLVAAGGGRDRSLRVWDIASGRTLREFSDVGDEISRPAFDRDGRRLAVGTRGTHTSGKRPDGPAAILVFDLESGKLLRRLNGLSLAGVSGVAFLPDGERLVSAGGGHSSPPAEVKVWDLSDGRLIRELVGHTDVVGDVTISPDGRRIATGSDDRTIKLWDASTYEEVFTLRGHQAGVIALTFTPDGRRLLSGSIDGTVKVWEIDMPDLATLFRREAVAVARPVFDRLGDADRAAEAIRNDPTLTERVRREALEVVERLRLATLVKPPAVAGDSN